MFTVLYLTSSFLPPPARKMKATQQEVISACLHCVTRLRRQSAGLLQQSAVLSTVSINRIITGRQI